MLDHGPGERALGGVAQLVERLLCKQEVIGSIPFTSTSFLSDDRAPVGRWAGGWIRTRLSTAQPLGVLLLRRFIRRLFDIVK